jgi:hypothetical protein
MKVFMLKTAATQDGVYPQGKEVDLPVELAMLWIERGAAVAVDPVVETAAVEPEVEQAVKPRGRPRKV